MTKDELETRLHTMRADLAMQGLVIECLCAALAESERQALRHAFETRTTAYLSAAKQAGAPAATWAELDRAAQRARSNLAEK